MHSKKEKCALENSKNIMKINSEIVFMTLKILYLTNKQYINNIREILKTYLNKSNILRKINK